MKVLDVEVNDREADMPLSPLDVDGVHLACTRYREARVVLAPNSIRHVLGDVT